MTHDSVKKDLRKFRGQWRDLISKDKRVTPAGFRVAYNLADYVTMTQSADTYCKTGHVEVYPSQQVLARSSFCAVDTVRSAIMQLEKYGYLEKVRHGNQYIGSNIYRLKIKITEQSIDRQLVGKSAERRGFFRDAAA